MASIFCGSLHLACKTYTDLTSLITVMTPFWFSRIIFFWNVAVRNFNLCSVALLLIYIKLTLLSNGDTEFLSCSAANIRALFSFTVYNLLGFYGYAVNSFLNHEG